MLITLTGATGFLGSHVLARLLRDPAVEVVALGRDPDDVAAHRLKTAVAATGCAVPEDFDSRVRPLRITLEDEHLGLSHPQYAALARRTDVLWHLAGCIELDAPADRLRRVNVEGTRNILKLAASNARTRFLHTSTAYVAGARTGVCVPEDELGEEEFLTPYEESKFHAERLVHRYAAETGRPTAVLRPSVLVSDRPLAAKGPRHTLAAVGAGLGQLRTYLTDSAAHSADETTPARPPLSLRLSGDPEAEVNLLQVEYASEAMVHIACSRPQKQVGKAHTFHVVHPRGTRVGAVVQAVEHHLPGIRLSMTGERFQPTALESLLLRASQGTHAYTGLQRTYERAAFEAATGHLSAPAPLTDTYLRAALAPPPDPAHPCPPRPLLERS
ncbi:SDR family oxidoreductase [Streptomyces enissocaesilis]|uniref:SDR family oxidoreductase n=1 Tax=Streptomyces enissocaesilis TaxID=332589 RepID=A0ABP6K9D1_9ACTN